MRLQSSASVVASPLLSVCRLKPFLANMSSGSQLGACVTLTLSLFFHQWSGSGKASHKIPEPNPAGTAVVSW